MDVTKAIVCLADSRKLQGNCVAGRELDPERAYPWVRPVSAREHEGVSADERRYEDGAEPALLDVIEVPLLRAQPTSYQSENWLLDPQHYWVPLAKWRWDALAVLADEPERLWIDGYSTRHGMNDQVPLSQAAELRGSLYLLRLAELVLRVDDFDAGPGGRKRRIQAGFEYNEASYRLWCTDPVVEAAYRAKPNGTYTFHEPFVTVSLSEPFQGRCYKLVAALLTRQRALGESGRP